MKKAKESKNVITNYDYFYYASVASPILDPRELLILDEAHNLERKMLMLSSSELNREYISTKFGIDIFEPLMVATNSINKLKKDSDYWIRLCDDLIKECNKRIKKIEGDANKSVQVTLDEFESDPTKYSNFDYVEKQNLDMNCR